MFQRIIYTLFLAGLSGCVVPISSSCMDSQKYEHPAANNPPKNSKCSATDAAVYVVAATLKTLEYEEKNKRVKANKTVKCSDMVGKAHKECNRKERESYDPLEEL